jgi:hypothetical protein
LKQGRCIDGALRPLRNPLKENRKIFRAAGGVYAAVWQIEAILPLPSVYHGGNSALSTANNPLESGVSGVIAASRLFIP